MSRRARVGIGLCVLVVLVAGWMLWRGEASEPSTPPQGIATCELDTLPDEVGDTVQLIHSDGPFPFPRNDGGVFGNREGHLPDQARGYYREYTVITPGARDRSSRRIVAGGSPMTDPAQFFYTADHYDSFCLVTEVGGRQ